MEKIYLRPYYQEQEMLLSICIPTLNRLEFLKESLSSLLPAAQSLNVEVCVSDNSSSDGTFEYLKNLLPQYPCLRIQRSEVMLDIDSSMLSAIAMGRAEYILPLGDDDVLESKSLDLLLPQLQLQCDMIVLNGWHTGPQLQKSRLHLNKSVAGKQYDRPDIAFAELWDLMPFGSFVARAKLFEGSAIYSYRFKGTSHAYTGVFWDALARQFEFTSNCRIRCMSEPIVLLRGAEKTWRKDAVDILLFQIGDWFKKISHQEIYKKVVVGAMKNYGRNLKFKKLIRYRCAGALNRDDFLKLAIIWPQKRLTILAAMRLPSTWLRLYLKMRRIDYSITGF